MKYNTHLVYKPIVFFLALIHIVLFSWAFFLYTGSKFMYLTFTISFFILLISGLRQILSYSYLFLTIFFWLGYWLKFTIHTIFIYDYNEPIGKFIESPTSLDQVLFIAIVGCWGVLVARYLLSFFNVKSSIYSSYPGVAKVPVFYENKRKLILPSLIISFFVVVSLNFIWGVFQVGLVPSTILIWPLNSLFSWLLGIGFGLIISTVLWFELQREVTSSKFIYFVLYYPFFISISILSRATYIFNIIPLAVAFFINRNQFQHVIRRMSTNTILIFALLSVPISFIISIKVVSVIRDHYYSDPHLPSSNTNLSNKNSFPLVAIFQKLIVDRWIGVEGIMAVSSYPSKNISLLKKGFLEKSEIGKIGMYQFIAKSHYIHTDVSRWIFATIPGPIAFFYYSGSLYITFLGLFLLTLIMIYSEFVISYLTGNMFLCSIFAIYIANNVAQFGITPSMMFKQYLLIYAYCSILYIIQRIIPLQYKIVDFSKVSYK